VAPTIFSCLRGLPAESIYDNPIVPFSGGEKTTKKPVPPAPPLGAQPETTPIRPRSRTPGWEFCVNQFKRLVLGFPFSGPTFLAFQSLSPACPCFPKCGAGCAKEWKKQLEPRNRDFPDLCLQGKVGFKRIPEFLRPALGEEAWGGPGHTKNRLKPVGGGGPPLFWGPPSLKIGTNETKKWKKKREPWENALVWRKSFRANTSRYSTAFCTKTAPNGGGEKIFFVFFPPSGASISKMTMAPPVGKTDQERNMFTFFEKAPPIPETFAGNHPRPPFFCGSKTCRPWKETLGASGFFSPPAKGPGCFCSQTGLFEKKKLENQTMEKRRGRDERPALKPLAPPNPLFSAHFLFFFFPEFRWVFFFPEKKPWNKPRTPGGPRTGGPAGCGGPEFFCPKTKTMAPRPASPTPPEKGTKICGNWAAEKKKKKTADGALPFCPNLKRPEKEFSRPGE